MTSQLSYQDKTGYYGLRIEPTFDQMLGSLKRKVRIPQPDRSAKWYATGPYRAFLLDQAKRFNDAERQDLEYDASGAQMPRAVGKGSQPSGAGKDATWDRHRLFNVNLDTEEAKRIALQAMETESQKKTRLVRNQQLSAYGQGRGHWTIEAHHEDLEYKGVPHPAPAPRMTMAVGRWQAPHQDYAAEGIPQAPEFPTFEEVNGLQDRRYTAGKPSEPGANTSYQQLRENYLT